MSRLIKHLRRWNIWRKYNRNCKLHKFFVLIGFIKSPTMMNVLLPEEKEKIFKGLHDGLTVRATYLDEGFFSKKSEVN